MHQCISHAMWQLINGYHPAANVWRVKMKYPSMAWRLIGVSAAM